MFMIFKSIWLLMQSSRVIFPTQLCKKTAILRSSSHLSLFRQEKVDVLEDME